MELTADNVHKVFMKCLFNEEEPKENYKVGEGVRLKVGFHPERLKQAEQSITEMLDCLPPEFRKDSGGGWSFLNMCMDKNGVQWADLHQTMDELVALGIASGKLAFTFPREMWSILTGGMPYVVIK